MSEQRTIDTPEELDSLPVGSVVLSETYRHHENDMQISFQRWIGGDWHRGGRAASTHPDYFLPVTVLHEPARAASIRDLVGIAPDMTDGMSLVDWVRAQRDRT